MSDVNTTTSFILEKLSEHNQSIQKLSHKLGEYTQGTINDSSNLSKDDIEAIISNRLLDSVEGVNSSIDILLTLVFGIVTVYSLAIGFKFLSTRKIKDEVLKEVKKGITEEIHVKSIEIDKNIKKSIVKYQQSSQKDEYLRNLIFYDLSKILATDINDYGEESLRKVFNLYSTRLLVATQLTSGNEKEIKIALKTISQPSYSIFLSLTSVRNYMKTLESRDVLHIEKELLLIKERIDEDNSIF